MDTVSLLPPGWVWGSKLWSRQMSSPWGMQNDQLGLWTTPTCPKSAPTILGPDPSRHGWVSCFPAR